MRLGTLLKSVTLIFVKKGGFVDIGLFFYVRNAGLGSSGCYSAFIHELAALENGKQKLGLENFCR